MLCVRRTVKRVCIVPSAWRTAGPLVTRNEEKRAKGEARLVVAFPQPAAGPPDPPAGNVAISGKEAAGA